MNSLQLLSRENFRLENSESGKILATSIPGFSLVLFYSKSCKYCHDFLPIFKSLPSKIRNCQFGIVNVSQNVDIINMSKQTNVHIRYVPYVILYLNGKPLVRYDGERSEAQVIKFIMEIMAKINKKQFRTPAQSSSRQNDIPIYSIGKPKCDGDVCYLDFSSAYNVSSSSR